MLGYTAGVAAAEREVVVRSAHDRAVLRGIERQLQEEDPTLVSWLRAHSPRPSTRAPATDSTTAGGASGYLAGAAVAALLFAADFPLLAVLTALITLDLWLSARRGPRG